MSVDDSFRTHPLEMVLRPEGTPAPMATCPRDGEPLVMTFEFDGAEFICVVCGMKYGWLAPSKAAATPELTARLAELQVQYDHERDERSHG